jgi:hypothetical protein
MNKKSALPHLLKKTALPYLFKKNALLHLLILLLVILASPPPSLSVIAPESGPVATGEGQFTFNGEQVDFSFQAKANKNGAARGRALFETAETSVEVKIDCLSVGSFTASLSGTVKKTDDPAFPKHAQVVFAAFDGDLFAGRPDEITPLFLIPGSELDCNDLTPLTILPLDDGEITIH